MEDYRRNIRLYPLYRLCFGLLIIGPVLTPYLRAKGLVYTQIMLLQSISAVALVLFEVPTGIVADRVSRRLSLLLSSLCVGAGLVVYIVSSTFLTLAVGEVLVALGLTFRSGADAAFLHESLDRLGRAREYTRIEGQAVSWIFVGQSLGTFVCSLLYEMDPDLPFWVSVAATGAAAMVTLRFHEPRRHKAQRTYSAHVLHSFGVALRSGPLRWTLALAAVMGVAARAGFWLYEPYFARVDIPIIWYGPVFGVFNLIAALAARLLTHRLPDARISLPFMTLVLAFTFLLPALVVSAWSILIISLQQLVRAAYKPTVSAWVNRQVGDDVRATLHSIVGIVAALSFAGVSPFIGIALDAHGAVWVYMIMGNAVGICAMVLLAWRIRFVPASPD